MIPLYTFDHALFLALNFDGGPVMDRLMTIVSGTAMWLPLYALILWLVWRPARSKGCGPISRPAGGRCSPPRSKGWRSRPTH